MKTRDPIGQPGSILLVEDDPDAGDTVAILTLTRGARGGDQAQRARESQQAADLIGARLFLDDLDDTHIAEGNPTIDIIEQVVAEIRPTVVYTHSLHDVH
jgi:two-component system response regulator HydG